MMGGGEGERKGGQGKGQDDERGMRGVDQTGLGIRSSIFNRIDNFS